MAPNAEIAVIIAAYNASDTILRAINSALAQTAKVEVIVVDDCSQDDTVAIAKSVQDPRLKVISQSKNMGAASTRNNGIETSTAPWLAVLDSDDFMAPDRLARLLAEATACGADFLADDIYRVANSDLNSTQSPLWQVNGTVPERITFEIFVDGNRRNRHGNRGELGFVKPLMNRSFLERNGLRYAEGMRLAEDYLLYAEALAAGCNFQLVGPKGYFAVHRDDSLSSNHTTADLGAVVAVDRALLTRPELSQRDKAALRRHLTDVRKEWAWRRTIDAVKARDLGDIASLAVEPPAVSLSVMGKLLEQVWLRGRRRLTGET